GSAPYHPKMLLSLLFYGYATGVFSSRKLERAAYDSVAFRFIAANTYPDHDTIATFRRRFLKQLSGLFVQILEVAHGMELVKLGRVSLDGTKMKANASKHSALSWGHANRLEKQLRREVDELMRLAEEADAEDIPDGMSLPEELSRREDRMAAIGKAKAEIEARAAERHARDRSEFDEKVNKRRERERRTGHKARGREPKAPEPGPKDSDQVNLTDEESRIMPVSGGGFEQAYNAQASVDMDTMLVVGAHVSQAPNDKLEIEAAVKALKSLPKDLGKVDTLVADTGYFSEKNVKHCDEKKIAPLIASKREPHHPSLLERFMDNRDMPPPDPDDAVACMQHHLQSKQGKEIYARRKCTVEPVFGIIKNVLGFRQFSMRGMEKVQGEWQLICMAWNIKRMFALKAA
ncbi:MAG: transposase, partial [Mariprofundaceae bacterium]|nr:transposase [Mariprofundaceae bacterium]